MLKATKLQHIKVFSSASHTTSGCPPEASETTALLHVDTDMPRGISHPKAGVNPLTSPGPATFTHWLNLNYDAFLVASLMEHLDSLRRKVYPCKRLFKLGTHQDLPCLQ